MGFFPICLDMTDRCCVVVGGGRVAERKIGKILSYGARIRVVSPMISLGLRQLLYQDQIEWQERSYRAEDLDGAYLVIAATPKEVINRKVAQDAKARGILVNVVDSARESSCIFPAVLEEDGVIVAVSSNGRSPGLSKRIRDRFKGVIDSGLKG
ncbi:MAG: bifunctional precorrin-2 dehydrogenase/sirohydrochlorin ferrochelatase [Thermodesulfobacteriota bacterium]